jgi:hypothetical protein
LNTAQETPVVNRCPQEKDSMKLRFSPFLLCFLAAVCVLGAALNGARESDLIFTIYFCLVIVVSVGWVWTLLRQARTTGVAAFPVLFWYWDIDRRSSEWLYQWAVVSYYVSLFLGIVLAVALIADLLF